MEMSAASSQTADEPILVSGARARELLGIRESKYWKLVRLGVIELAELGPGTHRMPTMRSLKKILAS